MSRGSSFIPVLKLYKLFFSNKATNFNYNGRENVDLVSINGTFKTINSLNPTKKMNMIFQQK